jgi:hypothetical protein
MSAIDAQENELSGDDAQTSTHRPPTMTASTTIQSRIFVATDASAMPNMSTASSLSFAFNATSIFSTKVYSSSNMTSNYDGKNSSNTAFSIRFTTMKPCECKLELNLI